jgi:hypothetical protein
MYSTSGTGLDTLDVSLLLSPRGFLGFGLLHSRFCCLEVLLDASFRFSLRDAQHYDPILFNLSMYVPM